MGKALRILIIEDSEEDAGLLLRELQRGGYEVVFERVETTQAMQSALARKSWDLVLSDYTLPQFDAPRALEILKASGLDLPFIIISGTIGEETAVTALKAGAHDFLIKGKFARLGPAIERELREAQSRRERIRAEEAFRASEHRFRRYFELGLVGMAITAPGKGFIEVNDQICEMLGYERAELLQITWDALTHPDDLAVELDNYNQLLAGQINGYSMEKRFIHKSGGVIHASISVNSVRRADGAVDYLVALMEDITERKQAEAELRKSEEQYRSLFEDSPISLWLEDVSQVKRRLDELKKDGIRDFPAYLRQHPDFAIESARYIRILDVNSAAMKLYHARQKSELLRTLAEVMPALSPEQFEHELIQIANGRLNFEQEGVDRTLTGEIIHVHMRWSVVPGYEDSFAKVIISTIDISERKRAEEALREKEHLLSEAQRIGRIGSWEYDIASDTMQYSDEMYRLFDVSKEAFPHNRNGFLNLIYSSDRPAAAQWMEDIRNGRQTKDLNVRIFRTNGELRHIQCRGAISFDAGNKPVRFTGMAQDVTERKLAEIQIHQQIERLSALRKIDQAITSNFNLGFTLNTLLAEVTAQLQVDAADILLLNPEEQALEFAAGRGFRTRAAETARVPIGKGHAGRTVKERRLIKVENLRDHPEDSLLTTRLAEEGFVCYYGVPLIAKGNVKGVLEIFHRVPLQPYPEWLDFLNALAGQAAIAIDNATLFENLQASNRELVRAYDTTIEGWSHALDLRDKETEGHTRRVTEMMLRLARAFGLPEEELVHIRRGCLLHDIGKMGVPDHILLKPGELTEEEWTRMRTHPQYAYEMLKPISFLAPALDIPYCHHEKWDGTGYPRGLKGEEIPLAARSFAVVDVWDALTSDRPYRLAWSKEDAFAYIREQSGKYFDPQAVDLFFKVIE